MPSFVIRAATLTDADAMAALVSELGCLTVAAEMHERLGLELDSQARLEIAGWVEAVDVANIRTQAQAFERRDVPRRGA